MCKNVCVRIHAWTRVTQGCAHMNQVACMCFECICTCCPFTSVYICVGVYI